MNVYLYADPASSVDWQELIGFLRREAMGAASISLRGDPFADLDEEALEGMGRRLAEIRVLAPNDRHLNPQPHPLEIDYERRNLLRKEDRKFGPIYSGFHFQELLRGLLPCRERGFSFLHIVFTNQRLATWEGDCWHLRTILLSFPVVISTTGLVEAPARQREYYVLSSVDQALAERWLAERKDFLDYNDTRLTEVLKGYLWQALFFQMALRQGHDFSFCADENCSLYNSHWQRELFTAQYGGRLCQAHRNELGCPVA